MANWTLVSCPFDLSKHLSDGFMGAVVLGHAKYERMFKRMIKPGSLFLGEDDISVADISVLFTDWTKC